MYFKWAATSFGATRREFRPFVSRRSLLVVASGYESTLVRVAPFYQLALDVSSTTLYIYYLKHWARVPRYRRGMVRFHRLSPSPPPLTKDVGARRLRRLFAGTDQIKSREPLSAAVWALVKMRTVPTMLTATSATARVSRWNRASEYLGSI